MTVKSGGRWQFAGTITAFQRRPLANGNVQEDAQRREDPSLPPSQP